MAVRETRRTARGAKGETVNDRLGDWMQTASGRQVWPLDPRPEEIHIEDIAHALSLQCRFAGHSTEYYSVGEHSVRVAQFVESLYPGEPFRTLVLAALLHDASEAYLGDVIRPLKYQPLMAPYRDAERKMQDVIDCRFGCDGAAPNRIIKFADDTLLATEKRDLMRPPPVPWANLPDPLPERILPWSSRLAEAKFLAMFCDLTETTRRETMSP